MKNHPDVLKALADARPTQLDPPATAPPPFALTDPTAPAGRTRRFRVTALIPAGALAVAAVAAVAVDRGGSAPPPVGTTAEAVLPLTAPQLLLAAGERSSQEAPGAGRYLVVRTQRGSVLTMSAFPPGRSAAPRRTARTSTPSTARTSPYAISRSSRQTRRPCGPCCSSTSTAAAVTCRPTGSSGC